MNKMVKCKESLFNDIKWSCLKYEDYEVHDIVGACAFTRQGNTKLAAIYCCNTITILDGEFEDMIHNLIHQEYLSRKMVDNETLGDKVEKGEIKFNSDCIGSFIDEPKKQCSYEPIGQKTCFQCWLNHMKSNIK